MHGRSHKIKKEDRLEELSNFQNLLRKLWQTTIQSESLISVLEGTDAKRRKYFENLQKNFVPPSA
jgi:hypothetical protein